MFNTSHHVGDPGHVNETDRICDKFNRVLDVRDYGAKGNGIADDTAAILAAIQAARLVGGVVIAPPGHYIYTQPLYIQYVSMIGSGWGTILDYRGSGSGIILGDTTGSTLYQGSLLADFVLQGQQSANGTNGLFVQNATNFTLERLFISNFSGDGIALCDAVQTCAIRDCFSRVCAIGLHLYKTGAAGYINTVQIVGGEYASCPVGIQIGLINASASVPIANGVVIRDTVIEANTTGINITQGYTVHISDTYFEACVNEAVRIGTSTSAPTMVDIDHCWVYNTPVAVEAVSAHNLNIERNFFHYNTPIGARLHAGVIKSAIVNNYVFDGNTESVVVP